MRPNLQIKVGTYTGSGVAKEINDVGFKPDLVIVKGGANDAIFRSKFMARGNSTYLSRATADITTGILQLTNDGFLVSTGITANENTTVYHYIALRGLGTQNYLRTGKYIGDDIDDRDYTGGGINFTPDIVYSKATTALGGFYKTLNMTTYAMRIDAAAGLTALVIKALISNGFRLSSVATQNQSGVTFNWLALKEYSGVIKSFTYTGNGVDDRAITGLGFQPDFVIVSANGAYDSMIRTSTMTGDTSGFSRNTAFAADHIQSLDADGFTIGSSDNVNKDTVAYHGFALKSGNFNLPITRLSI